MLMGMDGWAAAAPDPPPSAKASDQQIIARTAVDPAIEAEVRELRTEVDAMVVLLGQKDEVCSSSPRPVPSTAHRSPLLVNLGTPEMNMKKAMYKASRPQHHKSRRRSSAANAASSRTHLETLCTDAWRPSRERSGR
jgi:hypothetical protein